MYFCDVLERAFLVKYSELLKLNGKIEIIISEYKKTK